LGSPGQVCSPGVGIQVMESLRRDTFRGGPGTKTNGGKNPQHGKTPPPPTPPRAGATLDNPWYLGFALLAASSWSSVGGSDKALPLSEKLRDGAAPSFFPATAKTRWGPPAMARGRPEAAAATNIGTARLKVLPMGEFVSGARGRGSVRGPRNKRARIGPKAETNYRLYFTDGDSGRFVVGYSLVERCRRLDHLDRRTQPGCP